MPSSEAEWVMFVELAKEVMFIVKLPESIKISVKLPVTGRVHIAVATFMVSNVTTISGANNEKLQVYE